MSIRQRQWVKGIGARKQHRYRDFEDKNGIEELSEAVVVVVVVGGRSSWMVAVAYLIQPDDLVFPLERIVLLRLDGA